MALDLDQGGRTPQLHRTYRGPSLGWLETDEPSYIEWVINAGNSVISTGFKGVLIIPSWMVILDWVLLSAQVGSVQMDIYSIDLTQYLSGQIPQSADSICNGNPNKPIINNNVSATGPASNWISQINQNDCLGFNVDSCASIRQLTLILRCSRNLGEF